MAVMGRSKLASNLQAFDALLLRARLFIRGIVLFENGVDKSVDTARVGACATFYL